MVVGVAVLTLAIIGPLLRPGTLLLLDWVPGPRPRLSPQFWGFPPGPPNRTPIEVFTWLFDHAVPWGFGRLLPLAVAPGLAAWGLWRLFRPSALIVLGSTLFLIVNPWMYDRMLAGHLYLVDGIALLPLLLSYLMEEPTLRTSIKTGLVFAAMVALSLHFVFIAGLLIVAYAIASFVSRQRSRAWSSLTGAGAAVALCVYWIIPAIFNRTTSLQLSSAHVEAFRTTTDHRFGLLPNVLGLYGFWRFEWPETKNHFPGWILLLAVILLVVLVGFFDLLRTPRYRLMAVTVAIASIAGLLLALGDRGPTGAIFVWLFKHFPGFAAMREAQKFLGLLAFGYATIFGWGVKVLVEQARTHRTMIAVAVLLLVLPVVYGFRELWGFAGFARPSQVPRSWVEADSIMGAGEGRVLALPWHQYLSIPFAGGRILANPAGWFFRRDTLISDNPEVPRISSVTPHAVHRSLDRVLGANNRTRFARTVAELGVQYVLLAKYVDYRSYRWLDGISGLRKVREWRDLALYENDAFSGVLGSVDRAQDGHTPIRVVKESPVRYDVVDTASGGPLRTALTPAAGWRYGTIDSRVDKAMTARFDVKEVRRGPIRWSAWRSTLVGYTVGVVSLALVILRLSRAPMGVAARDNE